MNRSAALLMSDYELMQWAGIVAGGVVFLLIVFAFVRFARGHSATWPETAKALNLTLDVDEKGSAWTNSWSRTTLKGTHLGVELLAVATREVVGRRRTTSCAVTAAVAGAQKTFRFDATKNRPKSTDTLVKSGSPKFDAARWVEGAPEEAVRLVLTQKVRDALLACDHWTVRVVGTGAQVIVSTGELPSSPAELQALITVAVLVAAGQ